MLIASATTAGYRHSSANAGSTVAVDPGVGAEAASRSCHPDNDIGGGAHGGGAGLADERGLQAGGPAAGED
jgi:hypothetical protein